MADPRVAAPLVRVVEMDPTADDRWDQFVCAQPGATVYHLAAWAQILSSCYRSRVRYLALEDDERRLRAVMPLLYRRGPVSGARLTSLPACPRGGPLGESLALEQQLMAAACKRAGGDTQLIMTTDTSDLSELPDVACRPSAPRWVVPLDGSADPARWHRGSRNPARGVRRSETAGVAVREGTTEGDLRAFYRLYLRAQRRFGSMPRRYRQLAMARSLLGPSGIFRLFLAELHGRVIAGAVWHVFGGEVEGLYYGGDERYRDARPNHALYAYVLDWALERGELAVSFGGAAPGSSLAYFKAQWGARPIPLYFYVYPSGDVPIDPSRSPARPPVEISDFNWLKRTWQLTPLAVTRLGGIVAYRYL